MCLLIKSKTLPSAMVAKEDITCYKVVVHHCPSDLYGTPFNAVRIPKYVINGNKPFEADGGLSIFKSSDDFWSLYGGAIHTCQNLYGAKEISMKIAKELVSKSNRPKIYKCIIPKGTTYYQGLDSNCHQSFASQQIIFKENVFIDTKD